MNNRVCYSCDRVNGMMRRVLTPHSPLVVQAEQVGLIVCVGKVLHAGREILPVVQVADWREGSPNHGVLVFSVPVPLALTLDFRRALLPAWLERLQSLLDQYLRGVQCH